MGVFLNTLWTDRPRKSTPLNSHLVLNSLTYFWSISTAPDVHDHFLRNVRYGFRREGLFSLTFHVASPLLHLSESCGFPSYSRRQLVHHHLGLFAICQYCCPPTVTNSVQTIWPAENGENINRAFAAIWQRSDLTKVDPSRRVTLPQMFTWQKVGPPRRVALPSR